MYYYGYVFMKSFPTYCVRVNTSISGIKRTKIKSQNTSIDTIVRMKVLLFKLNNFTKTEPFDYSLKS